MVKDSKIISVSCTTKQAEFLDSHNLSSSELFQTIVNEQINNFERFNSENGKLKANLESVQKEIGIHLQFLEEIEKFKDYIAWRRVYVLGKEE